MRHPKSTLPATAPLRPLPAWARIKSAPADQKDAAFAARAALGALDALLRPEPVFVGA